MLGMGHPLMRFAARVGVVLLWRTALTAPLMRLTTSYVHPTALPNLPFVGPGGKQIEHLLRCLLLGTPPAHALPLCLFGAIGQGAAYSETLGMIAAGDLQYPILGQGAFECLQQFLEAGLGILRGTCDLDALEGRCEHREDHLARRGEARIQIDCGEDRLEGIGEDGFPGMTTGAQLPRPQLQVSTEVQISGQRRE